MQILYFSGTGNSLEVARELQKRILKTTLLPVIGALKNNNLKTTGDIIGLVFPIHALTMPWPVKQYIEQADFNSASYIFAITTRFCSPKVFVDIDTILKKKNRSLDASFSIEMPQNFIQYFNVPSKEEIMKNESVMHEKLESIRNVILNKQRSHDHPFTPVQKIIMGILFPMITFLYQKTGYFNLEKRFYADERCTGCGICEKVCLSGKIRLKNNKPEWRTEIPCTFCFACIHYCPVQSIQIKKSKTPAKERYHQHNISVNDIARQK
ncbi:MAG: EFR1 family ferrodoxin [Spirochaetales bacterium]|nr:EFR1 family ferrodoxin [Spirochaetales bacterium]